MPTAPIQMTALTLNAIKGWPRDMPLDFAAVLDPSIAETLPPGSAVHLNASGNYIPGVLAGAMTLFTFQGSQDYDVANYGGNPATDKGVWVGVTPTGVIMALVATGAYELVSTNYNTALSYAPNDHLTSPLATGGGINRGTLTKGTLGTDDICGVVSRGVVDNGYGFDAIAFWPVFAPAL